MPGITSGAYSSRDELEAAAVRLYKQGGTMRGIGLQCGINERTAQRILRKHGMGYGDRPPGVRPQAPKPGRAPSAGAVVFVQSPCWKEHCEDSCCAFHQEIGHV